MRKMGRPLDLFYNIPIRFKLLVIYSTILTLTIILSSLVVYKYVRQVIETNIESELKNSTAALVNMVRTTASTSIKNHLRAVAEKNREIVTQFYQQFQKGKLTEQEAKRLSTEVLLSQTIGHTGYIYCLNSHGVLEVHPKEPLRGEDLSRFGFIQEQIKRKDGYLEYEWKNPGEFTERPKAIYMTYFAPWDWIISVSSYREEFTALVNVDDFRDSILSIRFGKTGYPYVIDSWGNAIIHPKVSGNFYSSMDPRGRMFIREICERKSGKIIYPWKNPDEQTPREKLVVFDYLPELDWIVASSSYLDEFYSPLHTVRNITISTALITLLLVLSLTLWISGSITRPLRALKRHFADGAGGNLAARMEITSQDEIGQLARYFNDFMAKLEASHQALQAEINEHKQTEEQLKQYQERLEERVEERTAELKDSERRLADIISFLPDPTMVIDKEGKIIAWNYALEEQTGVRAEDMLGKGHYEHSLPLYGDRRPILIDLVLLPQEDYEKTYPLIKREGNVIMGENFVPFVKGKGVYMFGKASVLLDSKGNVVGAIETMRDISYLKQVEEDLRQAKEEAETASKAKSAFLAAMSHEIRTPMNGVIGMTSLLLDTSLNQEQREFAETIRISGEALLTIINDILDFSKIEAGKMELEHQPFNLRDCVEGAVDLLASKALEKDLELACLIAPHTPATIIGDVTRLRQVLINLIGNALKFTEHGEVAVHVTCSAVDIGGFKGRNQGTNMAPSNITSLARIEEAEGMRGSEGLPQPTYEFHFSVHDTGIGIPKERMDNLFQSFSQGDNSTTRKYGGTGLGLAISKRLIEMMGGTILVESEEGKGSTFHFTFQAAAASTPNVGYLSKVQPDLRGKRVLIVDDNATNRRILMLQTQAWGMLPEETGLPGEALTWIKQGKAFDVALIDYQMPGMDGSMLATAILKESGTLPLVLVSSLRLQEIEAFAGVFTSFLLKPIKSSQLYETLVGIFVTVDRIKKPEVVADSPFDAEMGKRWPLRILLAEDNNINQQLALRVLERLGYRAGLAINGLEVLEALERQPYDVILMDVQMPEMDGLEATRRIRSLYWSSPRQGENSLPLSHSSLPEKMQGVGGPRIIAMTASAMEEDREACFSAGMDDFVSKPIRVETLVTALSKCTPGSMLTAEPRANLGLIKASHVSPPTRQSGRQSATLDRAAVEGLWAMVGQDAGFLAELAEKLIHRTAPQLLAEMSQALEQGDAGRVGQAAHSLKSNAATFGATDLANLCLELEKLGKAGTLEGAVEKFRQIESEFEMVKPDISALKQKS